MKLRAGGQTDIGRVRERNEDSLLMSEPLFAVADGLGGHVGGEVASNLALETLSNVAAPTELADGVRNANRAVFERAAGEPGLSGMGTTLTAVFAEDASIHLAHVGDSRAYLLRDGELRLLTEDHTVVQEAVREGRLTPGEAQVHPQRSILTRALGVEENIEVDESTETVRPGDRILLCTDGLTGMLPEGSIQGILEREKDPQAACQALVQAAVDQGGIDNVTAVVIDVVEADGEEPAPERSRTATMPPTKKPGETRPAQPPPDTTGVRPRPTDVTGVATKPRDMTGVLTTTTPARELEMRGRRWPKRLALWGILPAIVLSAAGFGARVWIDSQFFVGVSGERVALFRGVPSEILGYELFGVVEETELPADRIERLGPWREVRDGITAGSEEEARDLIRQMERDLEEASPRR